MKTYKTYKTKSETDSNKTYLVRHYLETGKFVCLVEATKKPCPSYTFGRVGFECKHIKRLKKYLKKKGVKNQ